MAIINNYQKFNIKNISLELLSLMNQELVNNNKEEVESLLLNYNDIKNEATEKFFREIIDQVTQQLELIDITLVLKKKYQENKLSVISSISLSPYPETLLNLPVTLSHNKVDMFVQDKTIEFISNSSEIVKQFIKARLSLLIIDNKAILPLTDFDTFNRDFIWPGLEALASEYEVYRNSLLKYAFNFIRSNQTEVEENIKKVKGIIDRINSITELGQELDEDLIDFWGNKIYLRGAKHSKEINEEIVKNLNEGIENIGREVIENVKKVLEGPQNFLIKLTELQGSTVKSIENIRGIIEKTEQEIFLLEDKIKRIPPGIERTADQIVTVANHASLVLKKAVQLEILNGFTLPDLNTNKFLAFFKNGVFDEVLNENEKIAFNKEIKAIDDNKKVFEAANKLIVDAHAGVNLLKQTGILSAEDAANAGEFLNYAGAAVGIASSLATGNFLGAGLQIVGLFGRPKPQPSPEMKMLEKVMSRLDELQQSIKNVENKIDKLTEFTVKAYENIMHSLEYINRNLKVIDAKLTTLIDLSIEQLRQDQKRCNIVVDYKKGEVLSYEKYRNFFYHKDDCISCFRGLNNFTNPDDEIKAVYKLRSYVAKDGLENLITEEINAYENVKKFLFDIFSEELSLKVEGFASVFPSKYCFDNSKEILNQAVFNDFKLKQDINSSKGVIVDSQQFLSTEAIKEIILQYLELAIFFEISDSVSDADPILSLEKTIELNNQDWWKARNSDMLNQLKYLNYILNVAISQQSLISGNIIIHEIYLTLFRSNRTNELKTTAIELLKNNLIAHNFANLLLYKNLQLDLNNEKFNIFNKFYNIKAELSLSYLNALMDNQSIKFKIDNNELLLTFPNSVKPAEPVKIKVPPPHLVLKQEMIYTNDLMILLELKNKVLKKIIDISFTNYLPEPAENKEFNRDTFKYLILEGALSTI